MSRDLEAQSQLPTQRGEGFLVGDEDASIKGAGMGAGKQGVNGKVKEACKLISQDFINIKELQKQR